MYIYIYTSVLRQLYGLVMNVTESSVKLIHFSLKNMSNFQASLQLAEGVEPFLAFVQLCIPLYQGELGSVGDIGCFSVN